MSVETYISIGIGIATFIVSCGTTLVVVAIKFAKMEVKVDTIWDYLIDRAKTEAVKKDLGTFHSPFVLNNEVREWYGDMIPRLRKLYQQKKPICDKELFIEVTKNFSSEIVDKVAIPHNLVGGGCIWAAVAIAKEIEGEQHEDKIIVEMP